MRQDLIEFLKSTLLVLSALLPLLNPPGAAPIFLANTQGASERERRMMAKRIAINSLFMLLGAMFIGSYVLKFFGISLAVVKVGGGLLVAAAGWRLVEAEDHHEEVNPKQISRATLLRRSFFPLTFPFTVGPGAISVAITLGATLRPRRGMDLIDTAGGVLGIFLLCVIVYLAYRFADRVLKYLGESGITVFLRLSAFILLCIGVEIFWSGASELLRELVSGA